MNYSEMQALYKNKFSEYTADMCERALKDCHETAKIFGDDKAYAQKLWLEIDAIRDRQMQLSKQTGVKK
jgi:hypothetical protein